MAVEVERYGDNKAAFMAEMESLRPDLCFPDTWAPEKRERALDMVRPSRTRTAMFAAIPLKCKGSQCTFSEICPLQKENLAPTGKSCPLEASMVMQFMTEYIDELGVDPENLIEVSMIRDLVDQEIQQQRKTWLMSMEHFIQENVVGIANNGQLIMQKQLHLAVDLEDRIHRRKKALREQLLATREARAKLGQAQLDTAQALSNILESQRKIENEKQKLLRARMGIAEFDEYIEDADVVEPDPVES